MKTQVPVVATVSQQMDESGQLVVRIESIESNEMDQKLLDSIESSRADEQVDPLSNQIIIKFRKNSIENVCIKQKHQ